MAVAKRCKAMRCEVVQAEVRADVCKVVKGSAAVMIDKTAGIKSQPPRKAPSKAANDKVSQAPRGKSVRS